MGLEVRDFFFDSREVVPGSMFIATRGTLSDGHSFIEKAIEQGADAIVCEDFPLVKEENVTYIRVKDTSISLAYIAANFFDNPAEKMQVIGITGTNGKTTVATLLHELFNALGHPAGLISTVSIKVKNDLYPATHTTPDAKQLHGTFNKMVEAGCLYAFMEVSSHALAQNRVTGIPFRGAVFTNLTHDHLDYHKTFSHYIAAKQILFNSLPSDAFALTNLDDKNGEVMIQNTKANRHTYSQQKISDFRAKILDNTIEGLQLSIDNRDVWFRLVGSFNASNILAVYGTAILLDLNPDEVLTELSKIPAVSGRFQTLYPPDRNFTAIVDYAHTPDALLNVLKTIADINAGAGRIIAVVGCGGNRDKSKRPLMAKIASEHSDQVILTSDNPRNENPSDILDEMMAGVSVTKKRKVQRIENRREAIEVACRLAKKEDIILVAGKGHENYQEIKGVKHHFDDREILAETFKMLYS